MRILISGAGIAGPTLAFWLAHYGMEVTLVEKAAQLRTAGYIVDFWGAGFDVAERMGIVPEVKRKGYMVEEVRAVDRSGRKLAGFSTEAIVRLTGGRFTSLPRGDLAATIFEQIESKVETIFGDSVARIEQDPQRVRVQFESGAERDFDLVVGADGLHSRIRELVFGEERRFEKYLGYKVAAFSTLGYTPRDELVYLMYTEVGQQVSRFTMRGNRTMMLFLFADEDAAGPEDVLSQKALLRKRFGKSGWECPQIVGALDAATDFYFDRVSQIRMPEEEGLWTRGRVTLVGDAASCVSLLGGQGSALAMVAGYILAGELRRANGDYAAAFARYQNLFGPLVRKKQRMALRFGGFFAPRSRFGIFLRNQGMNVFNVRGIADLIVGRDFMEEISLPDYC